MYDVCIIGAGVIGAAIAHRLCRYDLSVCLVEKEKDVATGASKANSGIVHGAYSAKEGTLKGKLCRQGNSMFQQLEEELHFGFRRTGALVLGFDAQDEAVIGQLYENGLKAGCEDLTVIGRDALLALEPHLGPDVQMALHATSVGVASPYELTIAFMENAVTNGLTLLLGHRVGSMDKLPVGFAVRTDQQEVQARYVVNAAGVYSDHVAGMLSPPNFKILPRKGQYVLFGKDQAHLVRHVLFQTPTKQGKGILVTTTYHGNFMIGPNAEDDVDREDTTTDLSSLKEVVKKARRSIPDFNLKRALTSFSGTRAVSDRGDFIIEESAVKGFFNVAGIESPGLTSSPAIGLMVASLLEQSGLPLQEKSSYIVERPPVCSHKAADFKGVVDHPDPTLNLICRCEKVTEADISDALHRGIPVESVDAVKRRTRAGMGNCQGAFCRQRVRAILATAAGVDAAEVPVRTEDRDAVKVDIRLIRELDV